MLRKGLGHEKVDNGLTLNDRSGDIELNNIAGLIRIKDRSGDININGAADFKLESDGSGDVDLRNIKRGLQ